MTTHDKNYLGDGVYASHDGYQIWLTVERSGGWHRIALEPTVFEALIRYEADLHAKYMAQLRQGAEKGPGHELE